MAITGMTGAVYVSDVETAPVSFFDEPTTDDGTHTRYQVMDPAYQYWPPDEPIAVEVDGLPINDGFVLERVGGFVVFDIPRDPTEVVTVSGKALTLTQAGGFFNWSVDGDAEDADATTYESGGWKEFVRTLKSWSGSAEAYWGSERFYDSLGQIVVVKLFVDSGPSQDCLEGFALINGDSIEGPVEGLVQETVDFTGTGPLYIRM